MLTRASLTGQCRGRLHHSTLGHAKREPLKSGVRRTHHANTLAATSPAGDHRDCHRCSCRHDEQVRHQWQRLLSTSTLPFDASSERSNARRTQRLGKEAPHSPRQRCTRDACGNQRGSCDTSIRHQWLPLRRSQALLTNELVRGSQVLPEQLPRRENGRRQRRDSLRGPMVQSLSHSPAPDGAVKRTPTLQWSSSR